MVITAHYDHLETKEKEKIYPGADDNASGVAALLEIARQFGKKSPLPRHSLILVAFDAEELGKQGAYAFVKTPPVPLEHILLVINLDMIGRNRRNHLYVAGTRHSPFLIPLVKRVAKHSFLILLLGHDFSSFQKKRGGSMRSIDIGSRAAEGSMRKKPTTPSIGIESQDEDWTSMSDHVAFHEAGIPFLYLGVETHADYHQPTDTFEKIDKLFFLQAVDTILKLVIEADNFL